VHQSLQRIAVGCKDLPLFVGDNLATTLLSIPGQNSDRATLPSVGSVNVTAIREQLLVTQGWLHVGL
jgi:hypothetical protein